MTPSAPLTLFSVVIPARDEEESLPSTIEDIFTIFTAAGIPHEIVVIDDGTVVGVGTHDSLLADCPVYAEFADSQAITGVAR